MKRKVAVIMAADVVGYSRLMSENEENTVHRLMLHWAVFEEHIQRAYGSIFKTTGDAVLAEFPSSVDALITAVDVQEIIASENESYVENEKMLFRIGIAIGDVLEKDGDLLGDAVNIAARLESIAEPGGICVSQATFEQVAKKVDIKFKSPGGKSVKDIPDNIQVFSVIKSVEAPREIRQIRIKKPSRLWVFWTHKKKTAFFVSLIILLAFGSRDHGHKETPIVIANSGPVPIAAATSTQADAAVKPSGDVKNPTTSTPVIAGVSGQQPATNETQTVLPENATPEEAAKWAETVAPPAPPLPDPDDEQSKPDTKSKRKSSPGLGDMAYDWLKSKADAGDAESMNNIGLMYRTGFGREQSDTEAQKWFQAAVKHNYALAMFNLGHLYLDHGSNLYSPLQGVVLLRRASDRGDADASEDLGEMYYTGDVLGKDLGKSVQLIRKAAENGSGKAMGNLGAFYVNGQGVEKNLNLAAQWCQKGAEKDDPHAIQCLGTIYADGLGVQKDELKALELFKRAAEGGDANSMRIVGETYYQGNFSQPQNFTMAFDWYLKGANAGDVNSMGNLGVMYMNGEGVEKNLATAKSWLEKAVASGDVNSLYNLGVIYDNNGSQRKAVELFRRAADRGNSRAMLSLGIAYYNGYSVTKNVKLGLSLVNKAKQADLIEADAFLQNLQSRH